MWWRRLSVRAVILRCSRSEPRRMARYSGATFTGGISAAVAHQSRVYPRLEHECASRQQPTCDGTQERAREGDGSRTVLAPFHHALLLLLAFGIIMLAARPVQAQDEDVAAFYRGK